MHVARMISMYHNVLNKTILRSLLEKKIYYTVNIKTKVDFMTHMRMSYNCMNIHTSALFNLQHMVNINKKLYAVHLFIFFNQIHLVFNKIKFCKIQIQNERYITNTSSMIRRYCSQFDVKEGIKENV